MSAPKQATTMDLHVQNKIILITGGAKGIGAAIVRECVKEGAIPVIADKDATAAAQLQSQLQQTHNARAEFIPAELTNPQACKAAVDFTLQKFNRLDALVNNAGVNDGVGLASGSPEKFVASLERNLLHIYNLTHYALPALKKSRGAIVNISSKTAVTGQGNTSGYVAAKAAILGLTREWAVELLPDGIRVNAVLPAEVMTPLYESWLAKFPDPNAARARIESRIPLGHRMTTAEEIAATVVFLLSDKSSHTTGQHLYVDGGYVHLDRSLS
jgi:L-fucose dehydrogenase